MSKPNFQTGAAVIDGWRDDVLSGKPPTLYPIGQGELARIEIGPGLVTLIGGAPGAGKTAFTMQAAVDALRLTPTLRGLVCNVEMPPAVLLDRQLARLSGIDLGTVRHRRLTPEHADRIDQAMNTLEALGERLGFVRPPFNVENVAAAADALEADLILLDYIQRIAPPGDHDNRRGSVDATMSYLREFADAGQALIVVSAVARGKDRRGRATYDGDALNLASFRESSELEFGADDAFILTSDGQKGFATLRHFKARNGEAKDLPLLFDKARQSFRPLESTGPEAPGERRKIQSTLAALWERTDPASEDDEGGE